MSTDKAPESHDIEQAVESPNTDEKTNENDNTETEESPVNTKLNHYNFVNVAAFILNLLVTYGIGTLGWGNRPTNGELSDKYQTIITPFSTSFIIWAPIFLLQGIWALLWQFVYCKQRNHPAVFAIGYWYLIVCLVQAGWTLSFSFEINWLALIFMLSILLCLGILHYRLQQCIDEKQRYTWKGYLIWQLPFSLHLGWITAASVLNINVVLVAYGASANAQFGFAIASLVLLLIAVGAYLAERPNSDFAPPLALVWALGGVYAELQNPSGSIVRRFSSSQIDGFQLGVLITMCVAIAAVALKLGLVLFERFRRSKN